MWSKTDKFFMARALDLAKKGKYTTSPNPCVGCVIVRDGKILGEGYHIQCGHGHAEVNALNDANHDVKGATVYVTLEPCSHYGRTPPCAKTLVEHEVKRVVVAMQDPNPLVQGKGIAILKDHNIQVDVGLYAKKAYNLNRAFFKSISTNTPYVVVKLGMSIDSKLALSNGQSKWITNAQSRSYVQKIRASVDAIITSQKTVIADNPAMDVRYNELPFAVRDLYPKSLLRQPLKVVLDSNGVLVDKINDYKIFSKDKTLLVVNGDKDDCISLNEHVDLLTLHNEFAHINLKSLLTFLDSKGVRKVLVEAGANLAKSFIDEDACDELCCFIAPKILGKNAMQAFLTKDLTSLPLESRFKIKTLKNIHNDIYIRYLRSRDSN